MDEILKLVLERNKKRQVLNNDDIKRICKIIIGMNNFLLPPKILFEDVNPLNDSSCAKTTYDSIVFYNEAISATQEAEYLELGQMDGGKVDYFNYVILTTIFHEFAHVRQNNKILNGRNDLETKLYMIANSLYEIKDFYRDNYHYFPEEVNAYNTGAVCSYNIYSRMPSEFITDNDKSTYAGIAMQHIISDYTPDVKEETIESPSEILFEHANDYNFSKLGIDEYEYASLIHNTESLTIYKRMMLGLPITYQEYAYVHLLYAGIKNGQQVNFVKKLQKKL